MREMLGVALKDRSVNRRAWLPLHSLGVGVILLMAYIVAALLLASASVSCGPYIFV
jgi:hypothetical protein